MEYPLTFEVMNPSKNKATHVGVLEFVAPEGHAYLPFWVSLVIVG